MWVSKRLEFADAQALTTSAVALTNVIDLESDRDIGPGQPLWVVITVDTVPTDSYTIALETDDNEAFNSATTIASVVVAESAGAGTKFVFCVPYANERYLRLHATPGDSDGAGTFSAFLTMVPPSATQAYPDNVPV